MASLGWRLRSRWEIGGAAAVAEAAAARLGMTSIVLFDRPLARDDRRRGPATSEVGSEHTLRDGDVVFAPLGSDDAASYAELRPFQGANELARRLAAGSIGIGAWRGGELVGAAWWHPGEAWIPELGIRIPLPPGWVYAYDAYTRRDQRGRGIARGRALASFALLARAGYRHGLCYVLAHNRSSLRVVTSVGWRVLARARAAILGERTVVLWTAPKQPPRLERYRRVGGRWPRPRSEDCDRGSGSEVLAWLAGVRSAARA